MKKILGIMLILAVLFSFSGCFRVNPDFSEILSGMAEANAESNSNEDNLSVSAEGAHLTAKKVDTVFAKGSISTTDSGLIYKTSDGKYGVISMDGQNVGEAKYTYCTPLSQGEKYFSVSTKKIYDDYEPEHLNVLGIADNFSQILIPEQYASFEYLSDRYIQVFTITEKTDNEGEAILYMNPNSFFTSFAPADDAVFFQGKWEIYDLQTGKLVPGLSRTKNEYISANNSLIEIDSIYYDANGNTVDGDVVFLSNGYYSIIENDTNGVLYDDNGNEVFTYSTDDFHLSATESYDSDYFVAKKDTGNESKYYICDREGKAVSVDFDDISAVYLNQTVSVYQDGNYGLYKFDGTELAGCDYTYIDYDKDFLSGIFILQNTTSYTVLEADGTQIASCPNTDDYSQLNFILSKETDSDKFFMNYRTKSFDITGYSLYAGSLNFVAECRENMDSSEYLFDTLTGSKLISGDYSSYSYAGNYVYAKYSNGNIDVYEVSFSR